MLNLNLMHRAMFAESLTDKQVECRLCPHYCRLRPGQTGLCKVRHNVDGVLVTSAYGRPVLLGNEPIEKKYLFHFLPGSRTISLGTPGCNLSCRYCINWRVSQIGTEAFNEPEVSPANIVEQAVADGVACIAFTYSEPTIFLEYVRDIAMLAHEVGLAVVAKSNGYMAPGVLEEMAGWLDGINIDLKGWQHKAHHEIVGGSLDIVLDNLRRAKQSGLWLEVSTLLVPGLNTDDESLHGMAHFIANELGTDTPWHFLRFFPHYLMLDQAATAQAVLETAVEAGREAGLHYVYNKEVKQGTFLNTVCPNCQEVIVTRKGFDAVENNGVGRAGYCAYCNFHIAGVFDRQAVLSPRLQNEGAV